MSPADYARWRDEHTWAPSPGSGLVIQNDLAPAAWIEPLLVPDSVQVQAMVPRGFAAYARVFFPFPGDDIVADGEVIDQEHISWTEMARRNGRTAHALMEAQTILAGPDKGKYGGAGCGFLVEEQFDALLPSLAGIRPAPTAGSCCGTASATSMSRRSASSARNSGIRADYYLLHGPHQSYASFPDDPNYWWPEDRAWCVVTDTDFDWAYVAGTAACIEEILAVPVIDAYLTRPRIRSCRNGRAQRPRRHHPPDAITPLRNPGRPSAELGSRTKRNCHTCQIYELPRPHSHAAVSECCLGFNGGC